MSTAWDRCPDCGDPSPEGRLCSFCAWLDREEARADEDDLRGVR